MNEAVNRYKDLNTRIITASILVASLLCLEVLSQQVFGFNVFFAAVAVLLVTACSFEHSQLCVRNLQYRWWFFLLGVFPSAYVFYKVLSSLLPVFDLTAPFVLAATLLGGIISLAIVCYLGRQSLEQATGILGDLFITFFVIGSGGASLVNLASLQSHRLLYWVLFIVVANDVFAYFAGRLYGKTKLSVAISPGKTLEGTCAGLLAGIVIGIALPFLYPTSTLLQRLFTSLLVGVSGQLFDLAKSLQKRNAQVKDSGNILPGHGGVLDRLDGVLGGALALHIARFLMM